MAVCHSQCVTATTIFLTLCRWLYIVCGCMTIPCGLAVLLILPDLPSNTRAWYLTEEEKQFALERAIALGRVSRSVFFC